jgi:hypothetical protein
VKAILDAGALIAIDKRDRRVGAMLQLLQLRGIALWTSSAAVAQVWRDGKKQANLARALAGIDVRALAPPDDRHTGELLGSAHATDVVDAHVALLATDDDDVLTSDPADLRRLLDARGVDARIVTC